MRLGRGHQCEIRIADISVSRTHSEIRLENGKFYVKDLKSKGIQVVEKVENAPFEAATKNVRTTFAAKFAGSADVMKAVDAQR